MKVAIIDIDGCLSDYPNSLFLNYKKKTYKDFNSKEEILNTYGKPFYNQIKNQYRESDIKLDYIIKKDAVKTIEFLKKRGFIINIVTSRPFLVKNVRNTETWLKKNQVYYDQLFFIKSKGSLIVSCFRDEEIIIIDDDYNGLIDYIGKPNITLFKFGKHNRIFSSINHIKEWKEIHKFLT